MLNFDLITCNILQPRLGHPVNRLNIVADLCEVVVHSLIFFLNVEKILNKFIYRQVNNVYGNAMNKVSHFMVDGQYCSRQNT